VVVRELKNLYSRSAEHSQTHWYLPKAKKAFRSRRIISEKGHYEPPARELVSNESIGILFVVTRTARCCIRKELL